MHLENALETAGQLRDALAAEVERARSERQLLRTLDARALFARAAERGAFLDDVARLEADLAAGLKRAATGLGLREVTLPGLEASAPSEGAALARTMSEVRALAAALREIDQLNVQLAGRAMAVVRGYVDALRPTPRAYDRRGARGAEAPTLATVSSKG